MSNRNLRTPRSKIFTGLASVSGLLLGSGLLGQPTWAAEPEEKAPPRASDAEQLETVVVRGIRASIEDATNKKRKSKQILEHVTAEDVGKLPDNNVVETVAHLTGVQITRQHGQGADISIRGLQEVGTTINGVASGSGALRSLNHNNEDGGTCIGAVIQGGCNSLGATLSDVPADLIKSVTVYKTRTADQVEGGVGGQVDIELRRPLDLAKGYTVAGSARAVHESIGDSESPNASLLFANRFETGLGEMGWLANIGYGRNDYTEQLLVTESPEYFRGSGTVTDASGGALPGGQAGPMSAYQVWEGVQRGVSKRPSANLVLQLRTAGDVTYTLEGSYVSNREISQFDYLQLKTSGEGNPDFSNVVLHDDGLNVHTMTVNAPSSGRLPLYVVSSNLHNELDDYHLNFETHWGDEKWDLKGSVQYAWSTPRTYDFYTVTRIDNIASVNVNFDSSAVSGGAAALTLPSGASLLDPANYTLNNFHDNLNRVRSDSLSAQFDATLQVDPHGFVRDVQAGARFSRSATNRFFGYRDSFPNDPAGGIAMTLFPTGSDYASTTVGIAGVSIPTWNHLDGGLAYANRDAIRNAILGNDAACPQCAGAGWAMDRYDWTTPEPSTDADATNHYSDHERSYAVYGQIDYGIESRLPVDGVVGVRVVRTEGESSSGTVTWSPTCLPCYGTESGSGKYLDVLPSINAVVHLGENTQLRLANTYDVQRPAFADLSAYVVVDQFAQHGWAGNPDLEPNKIRNYDISLEHYFGRGGIVSIGAYLKKLSAPFFYFSELETVPGVAGQIPVNRPRNAGHGVYQGYEFSMRSFFDFLPGIWKNFGAGVNGTYYQRYTVDLPEGKADGAYTGSNNAPNTSKYTANAEVFYSTAKLDARLAYNYRSKYSGNPYYNWPLGEFDYRYTWTSRPTSRLDAAVSYTPIDQLTVMLEASNLLKSNNSAYFGYSYFPAEYRLQARTYQLGFRFKL